MKKRMLLWTIIAAAAAGIMVYLLGKSKSAQAAEEDTDERFPRELIRTTGYGGGEYTL